MLPERWREVERLYFSALEREPAMRATFLAEAAGSDRDLQHEVQSLLNQTGSDSRLDRPVLGFGRRGQTNRFGRRNTAGVV